MRSLRRIQVLLVTVLLTCVCAATALAHAVVYPREAAAGAYERYVLRVPNERDIATTRVEITFPAAVTVVSFGDVEGWSLQVLRDSAQRIVGATWTGTLPPQRFVELPFIAVNPKTSGDITWPAYQTYADGERVAWTGAPDSDRPASVTTIGTAVTAAAPGTTADVEDRELDDYAFPLAALAAVLSLAALGLALRRS